MKHKLLFIAISILTTVSLLAQNDLSSILLKDSWQAMGANPSLQTKGVIINLPGVYNNLWMTNISFNDLFVEDNGQTRLDIGNAINQLGDENIIRENLDIETLGVGVKIGKLGFSIGHRMRLSSLINYPKALAQLAWEGNAQFIGETTPFGPSIDLTTYQEIALGASMDVTENIQIGARAKWLKGSANVVTERSDLTLTTSDEIYQLNLDADYLIHTANSFSLDGFQNVDIDFENFIRPSFAGTNSGWAFDIGANAHFGKLHLMASVLDLGGKIEWNDNVENYQLEGSYSYEGIDAAEQLLGDDESFEAILDTLYTVYEPVTTQVAYETTIGTKFYIGGDYQVSDELKLGLMGFADSYQDVKTMALVATANLELSPVFRFGAFYGLRNNRADNIGLNATTKLGPVLILLATDNIITAFRPADSHLANFRVGLNLVFGRKNKQLLGSSEGADFY